MTPTDLVVVLLLTYLACTIIDWLFAPARRAMVVAVVLVLSFLWVYGWPVIVARWGG